MLLETMLQCSKLLQSLELGKEVSAKHYLHGERWSFQIAMGVDLLDSFLTPALCGGGRKYSALFNWSERRKMLK